MHASEELFIYADEPTRVIYQDYGRKNINLSDIPYHLSPLVRYVYGRFKSLSSADELSALARFVGRNFPPMDEVAMAHLPARIHEAFQSNKALIPELLEWALNRRETTNYTYELEPSSVAYLISFVATTAGIERSQAEQYIREFEEDHTLRAHLQDSIRTLLPSIADTTIYYGRRLGWYALARTRKPKLSSRPASTRGCAGKVLQRSICWQSLRAQQ